MKKAFVVSTQATKFEAVAMKENLEANLNKLAQLGYDGVELAIRNPQEIDLDKIISLVNSYGLEIVAIGTGQAWGEEGLSLTEPDLEIRKKAIERLKLHIRYLADLKPKIIIGLIRGLNRSGTPKEQAMKWLMEGLQECADYASAYQGVSLILEPINRYETGLVNSVVEAVELLKIVNRDNVGILIDTFHMNIEDRDLVASIKEAKQMISHVHFADSNRWAPGWGHINFQEIIAALQEIGYQDYISAEIMPKPTPETCAEETMKTFYKLGL